MHLMYLQLVSGNIWRNIQHFLIVFALASFYQLMWFEEISKSMLKLSIQIISRGNVL